MHVTEQRLRDLYLNQSLSVSQIAQKFVCSEGKINYWLRKFGIPKRSIRDAVYTRLNPKGDPFSLAKISSKDEAFLAGLGIGLFWGEGTKRNKHTVRLGNSDPNLIKIFVLFLRRRFNISEHRLKFGIQIFSDMNIKQEEKFWRDFLEADKDQFYKTVVTKSGKVGTYKEKSKHGVLTIYFHNSKLQAILLEEIDRLRDLR